MSTIVIDDEEEPKELERLEEETEEEADETPTGGPE